MHKLLCHANAILLEVYQQYNNLKYKKVWLFWIWSYFWFQYVQWAQGERNVADSIYSLPKENSDAFDLEKF